MTREEEMALFEQACADWGFDFTKDAEGPNGVIYSDYNTGCMFGMFSKGIETAAREAMEVTKTFTSNQGLDYSAPVALARHFGVNG
jgi:hypothetical protein